jgi:5,10-methenyltetrahydromethanopterin hydrogenase
MQRSLTSYSLSKFSYDKETGVLATEASTLQLTRFEQIYDDACDVGISIISHKTGNVETFYLNDTHYVGDDLAHWTLKPVNSKKNLSVIIFND